MRYPNLVIARAAGIPLAELLTPFYPALEDELIIVATVPGNATSPTLPLFRHKRVRQAVLDGLPEELRRRTRIDMARRLAVEPDTAVLAAEQYLESAGLVTEAGERRLMAGLFGTAAVSAATAGNHQAAECFAAAAIDTLTRLAVPDDDPALLEAQARRHHALYLLGRLDEADAVHAAVERVRPDPVWLTSVTVVQLSSLAQRSRHAEAIELGTALLVPARRRTAHAGVRGPDAGFLRRAAGLGRPARPGRRPGPARDRGSAGAGHDPDLRQADADVLPARRPGDRRLGARPELARVDHVRPVAAARGHPHLTRHDAAADDRSLPGR